MKNSHATSPRIGILFYGKQHEAQPVSDTIVHHFMDFVQSTPKFFTS